MLEPLEPRTLMSAVQPSDLDQLQVELINRARANPAAEADRFRIGLNDGVPDDSLISPEASQPLAVNLFLTGAAHEHSRDMLERGFFDHVNPEGQSPAQRMAEAGYGFVAPALAGENIAFRTGGSPAVNAALNARLHQDLFVDRNFPDASHRTTMLDPRLKEIGVGTEAGRFNGFNVQMLTAEFAASGDGVFLTGVAYSDLKKNDDFYTPGEGYAGVTVTATRSDGAVFTATTFDSGGYSLALPDGTYVVTAAGGEMPGTQRFEDVVINGLNVKLDFTPDSAGWTTATLDAASGGGGRRFTARDLDGTLFTFFFSGPGTVQLTNSGDGIRIDLAGTTAGSVLRMTAKGGDGRINIASFDGDGLLGAFDAAAADLTGGVDFAGRINRLRLGGVDNAVINADLLGSVVITDWRGGELRAGAIRSLRIARQPLDVLALETLPGATFIAGKRVTALTLAQFEIVLI